MCRPTVEYFCAVNKYESLQHGREVPAKSGVCRKMRKERKKRKKQRQSLEKSVDKFAKPKSSKGTKQEKEDALKSLVKSGKGVTVIGKKSQDLKKSNRPK